MRHSTPDSSSPSVERRESESLSRSSWRTRRSATRDEAQAYDEFLRKQRVVRYMEEERERAKRTATLRLEHDSWVRLRTEERSERLKYMTDEEIAMLMRREAEEAERERALSEGGRFTFPHSQQLQRGDAAAHHVSEGGISTPLSDRDDVISDLLRQIDSLKSKNTELSDSQHQSVDESTKSQLENESNEKNLLSRIEVLESQCCSQQGKIETLELEKKESAEKVGQLQLIANEKEASDKEKSELASRVAEIEAILSVASVDVKNLRNRNESLEIEVERLKNIKIENDRENSRALSESQQRWNDQLVQEKSELISHIAELEFSLAEANAKCEASSRDTQTYKDQTEVFKQQKEKVEQEKSEEAARCDAAIRTLTEENSALLARISELNSNLANSKEDEVSRLLQELQMCKQSNESLTAENSALTDQIASTESCLAELEEKQKASEAEHAVLLSEVVVLRSTQASSDGATQDVMSSLNFHMQELQRHKEANETLESKANALSNQVSVAESLVANMEEKRRAIETDNEALRAEVQALKGEVNRLNADRLQEEVNDSNRTLKEVNDKLTSRIRELQVLLDEHKRNAAAADLRAQKLEAEMVRKSKGEAKEEMIRQSVREKTLEETIVNLKRKNADVNSTIQRLTKENKTVLIQLEQEKVEKQKYEQLAAHNAIDDAERSTPRAATSTLKEYKKKLEKVTRDFDLYREKHESETKELKARCQRLRKERETDNDAMYADLDAPWIIRMQALERENQNLKDQISFFTQNTASTKKMEEDLEAAQTTVGELQHAADKQKAKLRDQENEMKELQEKLRTKNSKESNGQACTNCQRLESEKQSLAKQLQQQREASAKSKDGCC